MILIISNILLKDKLSTVRDKCLAEHYVIASSLIGDMQALEQRGNPVEENIDHLMRLYSRYLQGKGNGLAVAYSGEWIYESRPVLCVYGSFPAPWQDYGLMYIGNLSDTIQLWRHTKNILFLTGAVVILIMSFFLF